MKKKFKGKAIYNPSGKAGEYSYWALNFYNGCSAKCTYCYNRHGITAKVLGANTPTLKKSLQTESHALGIFLREVEQNKAALQENGLFFNFVSDPFLMQTTLLNSVAMRFCIASKIPVKALTKQTMWLDYFLKGNENDKPFWNLRQESAKRYFFFGFTLTGHDELEPGAAPNMDRIRAIKILNDEGFKTWASIEPIIEVEDSLEMIDAIRNHVDLVKIGLLSGRKYESCELIDMMFQVDLLARAGGFKVYYKDSFLSQAKVRREELPEYCVTRDYNIFHENR